MSTEVPGWERDEHGHSPQAQMVNGEWWRPKWGCDSLQELVELHESQNEVIANLTLRLTTAGKQVDQAQDLAEFYKRRCDALQREQSKMRDPERKVVCDILANGYAESWSWKVTPPDDECRVNPVLSRVCERGTRSCEVHHSEKEKR